MTPALDLGKWPVMDRNFLEGAGGSMCDKCVCRLDDFHCLAHSAMISSLFFCLAADIPIGSLLWRHCGRRSMALVDVASSAADFAAQSVASLPSTSLWPAIH